MKPLCTFIPAFPIYPPEFSWIRERSSQAAVFAGELESGSRVVYLAADIDRCYARYHIPDHRKLLESAVRWAAGEWFPVSVQACAHVNCNAYICQGKETEGHLLIHLVNLAGSSVPLGALEENIPIDQVFVRLGQTETGGEAVSLLSGKRFPVTEEDGERTILLPRLEEQEILIISAAQK